MDYQVHSHFRASFHNSSQNKLLIKVKSQKESKSKKTSKQTFELRIQQIDARQAVAAPISKPKGQYSAHLPGQTDQNKLAIQSKHVDRSAQQSSMASSGFTKYVSSTTAQPQANANGKKMSSNSGPQGENTGIPRV